MGANQSSAETRSVSMDNPAPSGVIDVSEEVVQRLKLGISKAKQQEKQIITPKATTTAAPPPVKEHPKAPTAPASSPPAAMLSPPSPPPPATSAVSTTSVAKAAALAKAAAPPYPRFTGGESTTTSMDWRRQKDLELRANDQFWRARIAELEETLNKTNQVMEMECLKAIDETKSRLVGLSGELPQFPCLDEKNKVIACYRSNPNQTLNCADVVAKFSQCVAQCRTKKLESLQREQQPPRNAAKGA